MTDILTLPDAPSGVQPTDKLVITRGSTPYAVTLTELTASLQAAITLSQGQVAGRSASSAGAPQPVGVSTGLEIGGGNLLANAEDHLTLRLAPAMDLNAELIINSAGQPARMPLLQLLGVLGASGAPSVDAYFRLVKSNSALAALI